MTDLLIATHDQARHAICERLNHPGTDELLRGVVLAVLPIHACIPSPTGRPDPDCPTCEGRGLFVSETNDRPLHCHCRCPWCCGCEQPVCDGPCPTVEAIAGRLDLL